MFEYWFIFMAIGFVSLLANRLFPAIGLVAVVAISLTWGIAHGSTLITFISFGQMAFGALFGMLFIAIKNGYFANAIQNSITNINAENILVDYETKSSNKPQPFDYKISLNIEDLIYLIMTLDSSIESRTFLIKRNNTHKNQQNIEDVFLKSLKKENELKHKLLIYVKSYFKNSQRPYEKLVVNLEKLTENKNLLINNICLDLHEIRYIIPDAIQFCINHAKNQNSFLLATSNNQQEIETINEHILELEKFAKIFEKSIRSAERVS